MSIDVRSSKLSLRHKQFFIGILIVLLILGDVFFFQRSSDWRTFPILIFYTFLVIRNKFRSNITFFICLFLFALIYIQFVFSSPSTFEIQYPVVPFGEKIAVWLYLLLVVGVIQKWRELGREK